jgi:hypothetical protein
MIKSLSLLTRKPGITREQFVKHWVEIHAPLALGVPGLRRYVQSHIVDVRQRPDIPTLDVEIDGVAGTTTARAWRARSARRRRRHSTPTARCSSDRSRPSRWRSGSSSDDRGRRGSPQRVRSSSTAP